MEDRVNIEAILAIFFFILPLAYNWKYKLPVQLTDITKCTLSSMALPKLVICLVYLVISPTKALQMNETPQYLTIAVLVIIYLTTSEIRKTFDRKVKTEEPKKEN